MQIDHTHHTEGTRGSSPILGPPGRDWDEARIGRALARLVDESGVPIRLPVGDWWPLLAEFLEISRARGGTWPESSRERMRGLLLAAVRFSRTDGSAIYGSGGPIPERASLMREWARILDEPSVLTVANWWFGRKGRSSVQAPPPLPADGHEDRALALLRPDWRDDGDFLAIDHRSAGPGTLLEWQASGKQLLGPGWVPGAAPVGKGRGDGWATGMNADWIDWKCRAGSTRMVRTAVLLRGRKMALLADEWHGVEGNLSTGLEIAAGVEAAPIPENRALSLRLSNVSARVIPLALPALPYTTERGSLVAKDGHLFLTQRVEGRRGWLPLLLSWDRNRNRRVPCWRRLTVSERSRVCPPGLAFAARVAWGPGDGLVVYRSLGKSGLRSFLGHQTDAKMLIGLFNEKGDVQPLLKIED